MMLRLQVRIIVVTAMQVYQGSLMVLGDALVT